MLCVQLHIRLFCRLQTIYRLAHGGRSYKIDIYLRNWSIRTELQRRAYLYNIENNDSFHEAELNVAAAGTTTTTSTTAATVATGRNVRNETTGNSMLTPPPLNFSTDVTVESYKNRSMLNDDNGGGDHKNHQDSTYQKQYCNDVKTMQSEMMRANGVNIATLTEINTTARKTMANDLQTETAIKILCGKQDELIVDDRCITWNKSVRNCSEKKAQDAKTTTTTTTTTSISDTVAAVATVSSTAGTSMSRNKQKQCPPFNPQTTCEIGQASKPPKLKTQNTFISRLFLTDILDNI